jgi:hypothetical protein
MAEDLAAQHKKKEKFLKDRLEVRKALQNVDTPEIRDLKQLFKQFDVDGDGLISREDLRLAIAKYGYSATEVCFKFTSLFLQFFAFLSCQKHKFV